MSASPFDDFLVAFRRLAKLEYSLEPVTRGKTCVLSKIGAEKKSARPKHTCEGRQTVTWTRETGRVWWESGGNRRGANILKVRAIKQCRPEGRWRRGSVCRHALKIFESERLRLPAMQTSLVEDRRVREHTNSGKLLWRPPHRYTVVFADTT
ncbi:hypothetical protein J6590_030028 [Homalodisca vitripennis]|nr:hypothetical protein J6590_030028 [Homalodisca vitripennis]